MLDDSFSRTVVTLTEVMLGSIINVSKTTSSTLGQELIEAHRRLQAMVGSDSLPVGLCAVFWPGADKRGDVAAEPARWLSLRTGRYVFLLLLDRDLESIVNLLGRTNRRLVVKGGGVTAIVGHGQADLVWVDRTRNIQA